MARYTIKPCEDLYDTVISAYKKIMVENKIFKPRSYIAEGNNLSLKYASLDRRSKDPSLAEVGIYSGPYALKKDKIQDAYSQLDGRLYHSEISFKDLYGDVTIDVWSLSQVGGYYQVEVRMPERLSKKSSAAIYAALSKIGIYYNKDEVSSVIDTKISGLNSNNIFDIYKTISEAGLKPEFSVATKCSIYGQRNGQRNELRISEKDGQFSISVIKPESREAVNKLDEIAKDLSGRSILDRELKITGYTLFKIIE
jgi:hypothetical protein